MTSRPITCQIDGEKVETGVDFVFLGSQITAEGDCNHEIQRHLLLKRKTMTKLDKILFIFFSGYIFIYLFIFVVNFFIH